MVIGFRISYGRCLTQNDAWASTVSALGNIFAQMDAALTRAEKTLPKCPVRKSWYRLDLLSQTFLCSLIFQSEDTKSFSHSEQRERGKRWLGRENGHKVD